MKFVVDLFGLPGSGKTTMAEGVVSHFKNIEIYKLNGRLWGDKGKNSVFYKIRVITSILRFKYVKIFINNIILLKNNNLLKKENLIRNIRLILYFGELEIIFREKKMFYLSDNGLFQTFVSMIFTYDYDLINLNEVEKIIISFKNVPIIKKIHFTYVRCDYLTSYERINMRNKSIRSKLDNGDATKKILKWQSDIFDLFLKHFNNIIMV